MKVVFGTIVLNEEQYILQNIRQHYEMCDEWVIIEGADQLYPKQHVTSGGLSTDKTAELIRGFPDPDKKIKFIQHGWAADKCELRNRYGARADDGVLIVFDADEFLRRDWLREVISKAAELKSVGCLRIPHVHFWKGHHQVITGGYYDIPHNRIYRTIGPVKYTESDHNHPRTAAGRALHDVLIVRETENKRQRRSGEWTAVGPVWLHYGFCKTPQSIADKNTYYINRGEAVTRAKTTESRALWFEDTLPDEYKVSPWVGPIPEVMETANG